MGKKFKFQILGTISTKIKKLTKTTDMCEHKICTLKYIYDNHKDTIFLPKLQIQL